MVGKETIANARAENDLAAGSSVDGTANGRDLLLEFTRQSIRDLSRTLDGLISLPAIDPERIGALGLGYGAALIALFASLDPRAKAVALADCGAIRPREIDPLAFVGKISPRPILLLETSPSRGGNALYQACSDPRHRGPACAANGVLSSAAIESTGEFFSLHLCSS